MDISHFFEPIDLMDFQYASEGGGHFRMGDLIKSFTSKDNFPDYHNTDIVLIGVNEERNAVNNEGCAARPCTTLNNMSLTNINAVFIYLI
jgi:hypothetical protein